MAYTIDTSIKEIMQREVLSVKEDWPVNQLARFFTDNHISGAPVTSRDGKLVGVVSHTDIVRFDGMPEEHSSAHDTHEYYLHTLERQVAQEEISAYHVGEDSSATVRDIMTPMVFKVTETASIQEVADTMIKGHIHRIFVTRDNKISGIVTALDMLKVIRDLPSSVSPS